MAGGEKMLYNQKQSRRRRGEGRIVRDTGV